MGAQVCQPDGMGLGVCECSGDPDVGGTDTGPVDGGTDAGMDAADAADDSGTDSDVDIDGGLMTHVFPERDFICASGVTPVCTTDTPARADADRTRELVPSESTTRTYVVASWAVSDVDGALSVGFNLDTSNSGEGADTGTCEAVSPDFTSSLDPMHIGVDNVLGSLIPTLDAVQDPAECPGGATSGCVQARIAQAIAEGNLLLLIEVQDIDSLVQDPSVSVALYLGAVVGGGPPTLDGSDRLSSGQEFSTVATVAAAAMGDIFDGRLRVRFDAIAFLSETRGTLIVVGNEMEGVEVRFDITDAALARGAMGGHTAVDTFVAGLGDSSELDPATARAVLEGFADIEPSAGDPAICQRLSVGYAMSAVTATRIP